jgi:hypothetical protein
MRGKGGEGREEREGRRGKGGETCDGGCGNGESCAILLN